MFMLLIAKVLFKQNILKIKDNMKNIGLSNLVYLKMMNLFQQI